MAIHCGAPDSERYLKMYRALSQGKEKMAFVSTFFLHQVTNDMAVSTTIAEMRAVGYPVSSARYEGRCNGKKIYSYGLTV